MKHLSPTVPQGNGHGAVSAQSPARPRRLRPSPKTVAELRALLAETDGVLNSTRWWHEDYQETELAFLDRRFGDWNAKHPDLEEWQALGTLPATLAAAFYVTWGVIATSVAHSRASY
jgi:hypothetical protein